MGALVSCAGTFVGRKPKERLLRLDIERVSRDGDLVPRASLGVVAQRGAGGAQLLQELGIVSPLWGSRLLDQRVEQLEPLGSLSERGGGRIVACNRESVDQPKQGVAVLRIIGHGDPEEPRGRRTIMLGQRQLAAQPRQGW